MGKRKRIDGAEASDRSLVQPAFCPTSASGMQSRVSATSSVISSDDVFAEEPADPRLTPEGAVCDARGYIVLAGYDDLKTHFESELPVEQHPDPKRPGARLDEITGTIRNTNGALRPWNDRGGAGWVVTLNGAKKTRWIRKDKLGSWRLCFLIARLQLAVWPRGEGKSQVEASRVAGADGVRRGTVSLTQPQHQQRHSQDAQGNIGGQVGDASSVSRVRFEARRSLERIASTLKHHMRVNGGTGQRVPVRGSGKGQPRSSAGSATLPASLPLAAPAAQTCDRSGSKSISASHLSCHVCNRDAPACMRQQAPVNNEKRKKEHQDSPPSDSRSPTEAAAKLRQRKEKIDIGEKEREHATQTTSSTDYAPAVDVEGDSNALAEAETLDKEIKAFDSALSCIRESPENEAIRRNLLDRRNALEHQRRDVMLCKVRHERISAELSSKQQSLARNASRREEVSLGIVAYEAELATLEAEQAELQMEISSLQARMRYK